MPVALNDVTILGVHPVQPSEELFDETVEIQWGPDLDGDALRQAREAVQEHFDGLCLIELRVHPPEAELDWMDVTQAQDDQPRSNWQVPYDEQPVDESAGTWAFFLHCVDRARPLETPVGPRPLPPLSPRPAHLSHVVYDAPG